MWQSVASLELWQGGCHSTGISGWGKQAIFKHGYHRDATSSLGRSWLHCASGGTVFAVNVEHTGCRS